MTIVVTVTFNSSGFLRRQMDAMANQTLPVDKVIVVDNNSNEENKKAIADMESQYPFMHVIWQKENLGGAGGFETGVRFVVENEPACDYVWLMDDDAFPREDCHEKLLHCDCLKEAGCICPLIFGVELSAYQLYHYKKISRFLDKDLPVITSAQDLPEHVEIESSAFVGPFIKMSVVKDVGIPDGGLFIYGDDLEYIYRISRKYKVFLVTEAVINHRDVITNGKANASTAWKRYYQYRNRMLFVEKFATNGLQKMIGKTRIAFNGAKDRIAIKVKRLYPEYRDAMLMCIRKGIADGRKGLTGKIIDPVEFMKTYG